MQETSNDEANRKDYSFSYISKNEFDSIVKHVKRERRKKQEEKVWERFLEKKQQLGAKDLQDLDKLGATADEVTANVEEAERKEMQKATELVVAKSIQQKMDVPNLQGNIQKKVDCLKSGNSPTKGSVRDRQGKSCRCKTGQPNSGNRPLPDCRLCKKIDDSAAPNLESPLDFSSFDQEYKKVQDLQDKITFTLKSIDLALGQEIVPIMDEDELARNKMRNAEFASRFKRNYHYQIDRQINEVKKLTANESWRKTNFSVLVKKFKTKYSLAVQALQSAEKHFRSTSDVGPHLWLHDFLMSVSEMVDLFFSISQSEDRDGEIAFKTSCSNLLLRLESVPTKELKQVEVKKKKTKKSNSAKREGGKDNLWMYRNPRDWKAKASELARLRLAKMNKKKAAEAAVDRGEDKTNLAPLLPENRSDLKMEVKQREGALLRRQVRSVKEDQVRTMMEILPDATDSDHEDDKQVEEPVSQPITLQTAELPIEEEQPATIPPARHPQAANVHLITVRRDDDDVTKTPNCPGDTSAFPSCPKLEATEATQFRKALQLYQRKLKWYDPKIIESIDRVTERIYEELMSGVVAEINIDHIISGLIELELRR
ncbi:Hypothetical protein NTJ_10568 [Nesidiocoris tenuis]|uniref:Uncharacterized protein n=1 Tax=Nesidiocoris tenuis TaxID=355587 RepID=A0ABN7B2F1_9HEMI|nr:Hypothetical protein NTJ_10568 [Nesidiocoris tenuis]